MPTICVICGGRNPGFGLLTCSPKCHKELVDGLVVQFGEFKKVVRASTGEAFKVPTRDIIEKGIREQELGRYPRWED